MLRENTLKPFFYENKNNIEETWSILRTIINKQENDRSMPSSLNINGNDTSDH